MTPQIILNLSRISLFEKLNIGKASGKVFIMTFEKICNIIPMDTVLQIINIIANSWKLDFVDKMYCSGLFTDLKTNFRKKANITKQRVTADVGGCKFILLGDSVKIIDVPIKNNINMIKVDIFRSIGIVSEKRSGDGGYNEDGDGEDGDGDDGDSEDGDDKDGGGSFKNVTFHFYFFERIILRPKPAS